MKRFVGFCGLRHVLDNDVDSYVERDHVFCQI